MYSSQEIAVKIKQLAKEKGVSLKQMLSDCELGINFISQIANGNAITYINLSKIADYLNVSVDYLLGRDRYKDTSSTHTPFAYSYNCEINSIVKELLNTDISDGDLKVIKAILDKYN